MFTFDTSDVELELLTNHCLTILALAPPGANPFKGPYERALLSRV